MSNLRNVAVYLKQYREKKDLTQGELAQELGVSRQSVISLESGRCIPSVALAIKISQFFGAPVEFIFSPPREENSGIDKFFDRLENKITNINNENDKKERGGNMARDLMPWSPLREMMSLREAMDKFFEEPSTAGSKGVGFFHPTVGIRETDEEMIIEVDLPGVKEEELSIEVEDEKLIVKGERKHQDEVKRENYYHLESSYGSFSRVIGLPAYVESDKADAQMKDGILTITIPKLPQRKPRKIQIKANQQKKPIKPIK
jgi:HSP20 family protein